jgi:hypothetical protein
MARATRAMATVTKRAMETAARAMATATKRARARVARGMGMVTKRVVARAARAMATVTRVAARQWQAWRLRTKIVTKFMSYVLQTPCLQKPESLIIV